jgi:carnosine N-methyltransferase
MYPYAFKVLVPGSGLGRLPLEIASLGYKCQGNEFSVYMAMPSNYILNGISEAMCYDIYPWLDKYVTMIVRFVVTSIHADHD